MRPWPIIAVGIIFELLGAFFFVLGILAEISALVGMGWVIGGIAAPILFVGLISLSVEIGVRSARAR